MSIKRRLEMHSKRQQPSALLERNADRMAERIMAEISMEALDKDPDHIRKEKLKTYMATPNEIAT